MNDRELGCKIEQAMEFWRIVRDGPSHLTFGEIAENVRTDAREELGKVVREILVEGMRTMLDTPLVPDNGAGAT